MIIRVWATVGCFNSVTIRYAREVEFRAYRSSEELTHKTLFFRSKFRACLYAERINRAQDHRYEGTKYRSGFKRNYSPYW
jgi:hypothetical protein